MICSYIECSSRCESAIFSRICHNELPGNLVQQFYNKLYTSTLRFLETLDIQNNMLVRECRKLQMEVRSLTLGMYFASLFYKKAIDKQRVLVAI